MGKQMRKTIAILGMTGALAFGGAGLAHATTICEPGTRAHHHCGAGRA